MNGNQITTGKNRIKIFMIMALLLISMTLFSSIPATALNSMLSKDIGPEAATIKFFLPIILKNYSIIPDAPVLNTIINDDGNGNYTVSWSVSLSANTYMLEEDDSIDFSGPATVYSGPDTSHAISGKALGTYYYRVRASNTYATSDWSNIEAVLVTILPPECPQAGTWSGITSQGRPISFTVEDSPTCKIATGTLKIQLRDSCYHIINFIFGSSYSITNYAFSTPSLPTQVVGEFSSFNAANGSFQYEAYDINPPYGICTASGTWTAYP